MQIWSSFICDSLISGFFFLAASSHSGSSELHSLTSQANKTEAFCLSSMTEI